MPPPTMRNAHRIVGPLILRRLRARIDGIRGLPDGGVLLASNHVSNLDNYLLSSASPRAPHFLGKAALAEGLFGRFNQAMGMVPVARGAGDRAAIDVAIALLAEGEVVALFPEGTRSPNGSLHKFRSGLARIAAAGQVPVVPVGLVGTTQVWPRGAQPRLRRPAAGVVQVRFGAALAPPADQPRGRRAFTRELRAQVATLSGQQLADAYAPVTDDVGF